MPKPAHECRYEQEHAIGTVAVATLSHVVGDLAFGSPSTCYVSQQQFDASG